MLASYKLAPNGVRLRRIPRSCVAGGKCRMAFECLHRGSLLFSVSPFIAKIFFKITCMNSVTEIFNIDYNLKMERI